MGRSTHMGRSCVSLVCSIRTRVPVPATPLDQGRTAPAVIQACLISDAFLEKVEPVVSALRTGGMRDRISHDKLSSLVGITKVSGILSFPFALRAAPCLWSTRDVVSNPEGSADDLRWVAQVAEPATHVPFFPHIEVVH
jgi:hypothetical protein